MRIVNGILLYYTEVEEEKVNNIHKKTEKKGIFNTFIVHAFTTLNFKQGRERSYEKENRIGYGILTIGRITCRVWQYR